MKEEELILLSNVKTLLASRGVTRTQMMHDLNLTSNFATNLMKDGKIKALNVETLKKICIYLDCDLRDLFSFKGFDPVERKFKQKVSI